MNRIDQVSDVTFVFNDDAVDKKIDMSHMREKRFKKILDRIDTFHTYVSDDIGPIGGLERRSRILDIDCNVGPLYIYKHDYTSMMNMHIGDMILEAELCISVSYDSAIGLNIGASLFRFDEYTGERLIVNVWMNVVNLHRSDLIGDYVVMLYDIDEYFVKREGVIDHIYLDPEYGQGNNDKIHNIYMSDMLEILSPYSHSMRQLKEIKESGEFKHLDGIGGLTSRRWY